MTMVRYCAHCDEEFMPHVAVCSDCGRPLSEPRPEGTAPPPAASEEADGKRAAGPAPGEGVGVALLEGEAASEGGRILSAAGIAFSAKVQRGTYSLDLRVHASDQAAATELLAKAGLIARDSTAEPLGEKGGPCPACGATVRPGAHECPDCGLGLGGGEAPSCPRCSGELDPDWACPRCADQGL